MLTPALGQHDWERQLAQRLALTDMIVLAVSTGVALIWKFGLGQDVDASGPLNVNYQTLSAVVTVIWWVALTVAGTRDGRLLGDGLGEYAAVARTSVLVIGLVATLSIVFKWDMSRGYLAIAFPLGLVALLISRKLWRLALHRQWAAGESRQSVLVIGSRESADRIAQNFRQPARASGFEVVAVWVPDGKAGTPPLQIGDRSAPVFGAEHALLDSLNDAGADTVIVADSEHLGPVGLRDLAWTLHSMGVALMVSPNLVDVTGSRMLMRPIGNEPFIHLTEPQYGAAGEWPKRLFDFAGAAAILLAASPIFIATAVAIKVTSPGPVFYRQQRVGLDGEHFDMIKFRSMRPDADAQLQAMIAEQADGDGKLFKVTDDPRITSVGRIIRRLSIDELPQLVNVLRGDMSLVGPRPQRDHEVALYDDTAHRRLKVRPGMTGLWQVSGRSDLSWEDAIRLDTYYVENWSMAADVFILVRTLRAVLTSRGAY